MAANPHLVKDPNRRVQEAMAKVFSRFDVLGSLRQTHRWFHEARIELLVNTVSCSASATSWPPRRRLKAASPMQR